jgi:hypothetical protein
MSHLHRYTFTRVSLLLAAATIGTSGADLAAQVGTANRIGVSTGITHLAHQDLIHTPFVHGALSPVSFAVFYHRDGARRHFAEVRYSALDSRLTEPYPIIYEDHWHGSLPHIYVLLDGLYGLGVNLPAAENHGAALGAAFKLDLQAADYNYGLEYNFGYFLSAGLNAWYQQELRLSPKHRVSGRAMAPLVSWVARSPYLVNDDQFIENIASESRLGAARAFLADGELASWDRLQRLDLSLDYEYAVTSRVDLGASYRFAYLHSRDPRPLTSLQNSLGLITSYRF